MSDDSNTVATRVNALIEARLPMLSRHDLDVGSEHLEDDELAALLADERVPVLRFLDVADNRLTAAAVDTIVHSPKTVNLQWLALSSNPVGDVGLERLASSERLDSVTFLSVIGVRATERGARALANGHVRSLQTLQLGWQELGTAGARALLALPELDKLDLMHSKITAEGARALIAGTRARALILAEIPLKGGGLAGLQEVSPALRILDLSKTDIDARDIAVLASLDVSIERLRLAYCPVGDAGLTHLARARWLGRLHSLDAGGVGSSPTGRQILRAAWGDRPGLVVEE